MRLVVVMCLFCVCVVCVCVCVVFVFFQAEDGIRDLVRSRGLGDVYKRQTLPFTKVALRTFGSFELAAVLTTEGALVAQVMRASARSGTPVSYTHLTLPTSDLV